MESYDVVEVTVWCTVYNHAPYLRRCLDGIMMQRTSFNFEVLVHDDASTDGSTAIILEYANRYPGIIIPIIEEVNQYQQGKSFFKKVLAQTRGVYIAQCEGDDYWIDGNKLQWQWEFLQRHPEYVAVGAAVEIIEEDGELVASGAKFLSYRHHSLVEDEDFTKKELLEGCTFGQTCTRFTKNIWCDMSDAFIDGYLSFGCETGDAIQNLLFFCLGKVRKKSKIVGRYRVSFTNESWTARHHKKNNSLELMNLVSCFKYIVDYLRRDLNFSLLAANALVEACWWVVKCPSEENLLLLVECIKKNPYKMRVATKFPVVLCVRILRKLKYKAHKKFMWHS